LLSAKYKQTGAEGTCERPFA